MFVEPNSRAMPIRDSVPTNVSEILILPVSVSTSWICTLVSYVSLLKNPGFQLTEISEPATTYFAPSNRPTFCADFGSTRSELFSRCSARTLSRFARATTLNFPARTSASVTALVIAGPVYSGTYVAVKGATAMLIGGEVAASVGPGPAAAASASEATRSRSVNLTWILRCRVGGAILAPLASVPGAIAVAEQDC